jgi:hypothetical protein
MIKKKVVVSRFALFFRLSQGRGQGHVARVGVGQDLRNMVIKLFKLSNGFISLNIGFSDGLL